MKNPESYFHPDINGSHQDGSMANAGFFFNRKTEKIDWRSIAAVDIERITRDMDYRALQDNITNVAFCDIERELDTRYIDPNYVRLFKLAQLQIQYLLYSQEYLTESLSRETERNQGFEEEVPRLRNDLNVLKKECHRYKKMVRIQQMLMPSSHDLHHPCPHCDKKFISRDFLGSHIERRHRSALAANVPSPSASARGVEELELKIRSLEQELRSQFRERNHSEEEVQRAASFAAQRQEIDLQAQNEINSLKSMIKGLTDRLMHSEKNMEEMRVKQTQARRSNLGEIEDEDAASKRQHQQHLRDLEERNQKLQAELAREKAISKKKAERQRAAEASRPVAATEKPKKAMPMPPQATPEADLEPEAEPGAVAGHEVEAETFLGAVAGLGPEVVDESGALRTPQRKPVSLTTSHPASDQRHSPAASLRKYLPKDSPLKTSPLKALPTPPKVEDFTEHGLTDEKRPQEATPVKACSTRKPSDRSLEAVVTKTKTSETSSEVVITAPKTENLSKVVITAPKLSETSSEVVIPPPKTSENSSEVVITAPKTENLSEVAIPPPKTSETLSEVASPPPKTSETSSEVVIPPPKVLEKTFEVVFAAPKISEHSPTLKISESSTVAVLSEKPPFASPLRKLQAHSPSPKATPTSPKSEHEFQHVIVEMNSRSFRTPPQVTHHRPQPAGKRNGHGAAEEKVLRQRASGAAAGRGVRSSGDDVEPFHEPPSPSTPHTPLSPPKKEEVALHLQGSGEFSDEEYDEESDSALVSREMKKTLAASGSLGGTGDHSMQSSWDMSQIRSSHVMERLKTEPTLLHSFISELQKLLEERLVDLGIDRHATRITTPVLNEKLSILRREREQLRAKHAQFASIRQQFVREVEKEAQERFRSRSPGPQEREQKANSLPAASSSSTPGAMRKGPNRRPPPRSPQLDLRSATLPTPPSAELRPQPPPPTTNAFVPRNFSSEESETETESESEQPTRPAPPSRSTSAPDPDVRPSPRKPRQYRGLSASNGIAKTDPESPMESPSGWDTTDGRKLAASGAAAGIGPAVVTIPHAEESGSDSNWDSDDDIAKMEAELNMSSGVVPYRAQQLQRSLEQPRDKRPPGGVDVAPPAPSRAPLPDEDEDTFSISSINGEGSRPPSRKVSSDGAERGLFGGGTRVSGSVGSSGNGVGGGTGGLQTRLSAAGTDLSNTFGTSQWGTTSKVVSTVNPGATQKSMATNKSSDVGGDDDFDSD